MYWIRDDFKGLCLNCWLSVGFVAACFSSLSTRLLPAISWCPGIHIISSFRCCIVYLLMILSMRLIVEWIIDCPDCLRGWLIDVPAAWLSVEIQHFGCSFTWSCHIVIAMSNAVISAAYTLYCA